MQENELSHLLPDTTAHTNQSFGFHKIEISLKTSGASKVIVIKTGSNRNQIDNVILLHKHIFLINTNHFPIMILRISCDRIVKASLGEVSTWKDEKTLRVSLFI